MMCDETRIRKLSVVLSRPCKKPYADSDKAQCHYSAYYSKMTERNDVAGINKIESTRQFYACEITVVMFASKKRPVIVRFVEEIILR